MSEDADVEAARAKTRGVVRKVMIGTLAGGLVFVALGLYGDLAALRASFVALDGRMFLAALALATANYGLRFLRWQLYLRRLDAPVPWRESLLVFLAGFVMSVTPGKLGEVLKSLLLYESRGISIARTAPVVFAERLTDLVALVILTAIGSLSFPEGVPVAIGGAALASLFLLASAWRPLGERLLAIAERLPLVGRAAPRLREAYESLHALTRPRPLAAATALATVSWGLECVALWLLCAALPGSGLSWDAAVFAYSASTVVGALAMLPGGLGVTEASMTGLVEALSGGGIDAASASAATILTRLATLWWAVAVGAVALALSRRIEARRAR
ncbi:MAG: flippase-like domain-containing protein [Sandaracinaceae bacterium]|nr:flippase-like domain-containing protein [Sandaracinaceae bacterium]